jgi:RHS repeat-associated protein
MTIPERSSHHDPSLHDAYGLPLMRSIHVADVDYSGTVNATDAAAVQSNYGQSAGTVGPIYDIDENGSINAIDSGLVSSSYGSAIGTARVSSVGNPYLFTGRRMHFFETEFTGLGPEPNTPIQYNRARHYDPEHGRWVQRDPVGYDGGGMSLYEYVLSNPTTLADPRGEKPIECPASHSAISNGIEPTPNGCGSGWTAGIVPDTWPPFVGTVNLTPACNTHDRCYADCDKTRAECDQQFGKDIEAACTWAYAVSKWPIDWFELRVRKEQARLCVRIAARVYQAAVEQVGEPAHTTAQKRHCECVCNPTNAPIGG